MKYRVVEKIYEDGKSEFYPQRKGFIFWHFFREWDWEDYDKVMCRSLDDAHRLIDEDIDNRKSNHCVKKVIHNGCKEK